MKRLIIKYYLRNRINHIRYTYIDQKSILPDIITLSFGSSYLSRIDRFISIFKSGFKFYVSPSIENHTHTQLSLHLYINVRCL